jgi:hypothetical protein
MTSAEIYVARAKDAAELADAESDVQAKAALLNIAETWLLMAETALRTGRSGEQATAIAVTELDGETSPPSSRL